MDDGEKSESNYHSSLRSSHPPKKYCDGFCGQRKSWVSVSGVGLVIMEVQKSRRFYVEMVQKSTTGSILHARLTLIELYSRLLLLENVKCEC